MNPKTTNRSPERPRSEAWAALILAAAVILSFGLSLGGDFVWDDTPLIVDNSRIQDPGAIGGILTSSFWETGDRHDRFRSFFRPLISLSYAADHALWGLNPLGFHLTNLWLHFICCWLVYRLARGEGLYLPAALAGGLLFAVHPVHVESVAWISGRTDLVCATFMLGAFLLHRRGHARLGPARVASWILFGLAIFSKEMAATLPLLLLLDVWLRERDARGVLRLRRALTVVAPYAAMLLLYVAARVAVLGEGAPPSFTLDAASFVATSAFVLARYLTLLILPVGLDAHYPYPPVEEPFGPLALVAATMLLVVGLVLRRAAGHPPVLFWSAWIFIALSPVLTFGRFGDVLLADRFLYLPSVGLALLVARLCDPLLAGRQRRPSVGQARVVVAILLVVLTASTVRRSRIWRDDLALFGDMIRTSPDSALVRNNLGLSLYEAGRLRPAEEEFRLAVEFSPDYALAHNNLAAALERQGQAKSALRHYREALRLAPGLSEAGANAGHLLVVLGRPADGLRLLEEVERMHPDSASVVFARAEALDRVGRREEAEGVARRALELDPAHAAAYYLLGKLRFERGEGQGAAHAMRSFLELWGAEGEHADAARRVIAQAEAGRAAPGS